MLENPYLYIFIIGWISGKLSGKLTSKIDSYLSYGMILGFIRKSAAKHFSKNTIIDFDSEEKAIANIEITANILGDRSEAYEDLYIKIASQKKALMPFICRECMSEWINLIFSILVAFLFQLSVFQAIIIIIVSSIISRDEL